MNQENCYELYMNMRAGSPASCFGLYIESFNSEFIPEAEYSFDQPYFWFKYFAGEMQKLLFSASNDGMIIAWGSGGAVHDRIPVSIHIQSIQSVTNNQTLFTLC